MAQPQQGEWNMNDHVRISGFSIRETDLGKGCTGCGYFEFETLGMRFYGFGLMRLKDGRFALNPPRMSGGDKRTVVSIRDDELKQRVIEAAVTAYRALGGKPPDLDTTT